MSSSIFFYASRIDTDNLANYFSPLTFAPFQLLVYVIIVNL